MMDEPITGPAARTIESLLALSHGPRAVTEIADEVGLPKATVHRLLNQLVQIGMVYQTESQEYMLGVRALELGQALLNESAWSCAFVFRPELEALARKTGETVTLHVRIGDHRVCVAEHQSPHEIRYVGGVGQTVALHLGSAGKILLAYSEGDVAEQYLRLLEGPANDGKGAMDASEVARLRSAIRAVRKNGWAESTGERIVGASAVSVPVLTDDGTLIVVLSVLGPTHRLGPKERQALLPDLRHVATSMASMARQREPA